MPPNAVARPLLTLLYIEEMADQVLEMYWVEHSMAGLGWWIILRYIATNTEYIQTSELLPDKF